MTLVNISKEYHVYPNDYDPEDWRGYYDSESDWIIGDVWDDGETVWGEAEDGEYLNDDYNYDD